MTALEFSSFDRLNPNAKRGGLRKDHPEHLIHSASIHQRRKQNTRPAFLHDHRNKVGVLGAVRKKLLDHKRVNLGVHVVDIRLDDDQFFLLIRRGKLADHNSKEIRDLRNLPGPRAISDGLDPEPVPRERTQ